VDHQLKKTRVEGMQSQVLKNRVDAIKTNVDAIRTQIGNSMVSLETPSITTMAVTLTGGLGKTKTANGNAFTSALSRLVFPFIAYRTVGGLSDFSRYKLLSGTTSE
jgi:hypothetical protein